MIGPTGCTARSVTMVLAVPASASRSGFSAASYGCPQAKALPERLSMM